MYNSNEEVNFSFECFIAVATLECINEKSDSENRSRSPQPSENSKTKIIKYLVIIYIYIYNIFLVEETIRDLESQFGKLVKGINDYLQNDQQKLSKLPDMIRYELPQRLKGIRRHFSYKSITKANFSNFFYDLEDLWNFLDYDLLKEIICAYKNKELISKLKIYEHNIEKFCAETTINQLIDHWMPRFNENDIPDKLKLCVTQLSWDPNTCKVKDLKDIQKKLRDSLPQELAMAAFYICEIRRSSVIVVWLVWTDYFPEIIDSIKALFQDNPEFFTENKISHIILDNLIIYSNYDDKVRNYVLNFIYMKDNRCGNLYLTNLGNSVLILCQNYNSMFVNINILGSVIYIYNRKTIY